MSFNIELIGFIAAILTTVAFIPQVYKVWQTKSFLWCIVMASLWVNYK